MPVSSLTSDQFPAFFSELWGKPPFAWQHALAGRVLRSDTGHEPSPSDRNGAGSNWPEAIALPTGSGKTACMDVAVFCLAAQASRLSAKQPITAPRRVFFVVDRRVIVDEAYARASTLSEMLSNAKAGVVREVADNLRVIACGGSNQNHGEPPLEAHFLRGGVYQSETWMLNPLQPTVVASTVDQVGSRLLFRAYGKSPNSWPIYAGLIATNSLILLDEAHCAQPFLQTIIAVRRLHACAQQPLGRAILPVVMSATPPPDLECFTDQSDEASNSNHPLGKRQMASKRATLRLVKRATGKHGTSILAKALATGAEELVGPSCSAIVVFANRVATAREAFRTLSNSYPGQVTLLTGRMRPIDKDDLIEHELSALSPDCPTNRPEEPTFVVTTQALEVGANLDFDGLVTECASRDALLQRFGRLNRSGRDIGARAIIMVREDQAKNSEKDPVYGMALSNTWRWLNKSADSVGEVDFGIKAIGSTLKQENAKYNAPVTVAPIMLPAHVDCLAQTSPFPIPSPDVAPFLHGERDASADAHVCWRADIDLGSAGSSESVAVRTLSLCPPNSLEVLPVPIWSFRNWLCNENMADDSSDLEGVHTSITVPTRDCPIPARKAILWRGAHSRVISDPREVRPGDVVIIPITDPSKWGNLGDIPGADSHGLAALDIADRAYQQGRAQAMLRLHPRIVNTWPIEGGVKSAILELLTNLDDRYSADDAQLGEDVLELVSRLAREVDDLSGPWEWLKIATKSLLKEFTTAETLMARAEILTSEYIILRGKRKLKGIDPKFDGFTDDDDADSSGYSNSAGAPILLHSHLAGVERLASVHAAGSGLPQEIVDAISCAASIHDIGKADPRFQSLLRGGIIWDGNELLAKSSHLPNGRSARERAREMSGYPKGARHELLSVRLAESVPAQLPNSGLLADLVLHLIGSHHGRCRPFAPVVPDNANVDIAYNIGKNQAQWSGPTLAEHLDSGISERYWRLVRHYGWWGLAWLEALLRLADWRQSKWESSHAAR